MISSSSELRLYKNNSYLDYGICYLIYVEDGGIYLNTPNGSFKIIQKKYSDTINKNTIDDYAKSREFEKILTVECNEGNSNAEFIWENDEYENFVLQIKHILENTLSEVDKIEKLNLFNHTKQIYQFYRMVNVTIKNII